MASNSVIQHAAADMHHQQHQLPSPGAATTATSASTNPPDFTDGANGNGPAFSDSAFTAQIRTGLDMIHSAVDSRVATLEREVSHWRSLALSHQTQVQTLSAESHRLKSTLSESEQRAQALSAENAHLRATKQALAQKYTTLKKTAAQLESWRRTIIRMVEYTPSVATASASFMNPSASSDDPSSHASSLSVLDPAASAVGNSTITGSKKSSTKSARHPPSTAATIGAVSTVSTNPHPAVQRLTSAPTTSAAGSAVGRSFVAGADMDVSLGGGASGLPSFAEGGASVSGVGSSVGLSGAGHSSVGGLSDADNEDQGDGAVAVGMESSAMLDQSNTTATPTHHRRHASHPSHHQQPSRSSKPSATDRPISASSKPSAAAAAAAANTTANTTTSNNTSTVADAQALYRAIRGTLSAESFTKFAHTINAFNANSIGVEETVARVEAIVTDRHLFMQMRNLIYKAMAESSFARSTASTAQAGSNSTMGGGVTANGGGAHSTVSAGNGSRAGR